MCILNKRDLVNYIIKKHKDKIGRHITPIKLQKGLYFLYAFWGGKIRSQKSNVIGEECLEMTEQEINLSDKLFEADFEAWAYGPVDREIYVLYKNMSDTEKDSINTNSLKADLIVTSYIDDLLERIFASSDFGLVDLSHEDSCWKDVFDPQHKNKMNNEAILNEYAFM